MSNVLTTFKCPFCRVSFERPRPYTKGQSHICPECTAKVAAASTEQEEECIVAGKHLQSTDSDGYCNYCGYQ